MVRIKNREPVLDAVPYKVGDLEKNALEAAVQLREEAGEGKVTILAVGEGDRKIKETLKEALAMGADEAVIIADSSCEATDQAGIAAARSLPLWRRWMKWIWCCSGKARRIITPDRWGLVWQRGLDGLRSALRVR